jgi:hypothetical protein
MTHLRKMMFEELERGGESTGAIGANFRIVGYAGTISSPGAMGRPRHFLP